MVVRELTVRCLGGVEEQTLLFTGALNVISQCPAREIVFALQVVLCSKAASRVRAPLYRKETEIEALVDVGGMTYRVAVRPQEKGRGLCLSARSDEGEERTEEYVSLASHCEAQDAAEYFDGEAKTHALLLSHSWEDLHSAALQKSTDGYCALRAFRSYLYAYVRDFLPEPLYGGAPCELVLLRDGGYAVRSVETHEPVHLSESEQRLFAYLCFLHTLTFWQGFEEIRNVHAVKKPLLVWNFLERLDESFDVKPLIERTLQTGRQVILFTLPREGRLARTPKEDP